MRLFIYCERSLIPRAASVEYQVKLLASDTLITFALMLKGPDCHGIRSVVPSLISTTYSCHWQCFKLLFISFVRLVTFSVTRVMSYYCGLYGHYYN